MSKNTNLSFLTDYITADITNGRIGINTPSPAYSFDVTGIARTSTSTYLATASGNVGIGTTSPAGISTYTTLDIRGATGGGIKMGVSASSTPFNLQQAGTDAYLNNVANGAMLLYTNDTERMRITNAGNVGIGTSSPGGKLQINNTSTQYVVYTSSGNIEVYQPETTASGTQVRLGSAYNLPGVYSNGQLNLNSDSGNAIAFNTNGNTERMRITSGGNVGINYVGDSSTRLGIYGVGTTSGTFGFLVANSAGTTSMWVKDNGDGYLRASAWAYGSDIRMKENISDVSNGLDLVTKLKPKHFDYINGAKDNLGFIAQEVQELIPQAVSISDEKTGMLALKTDFIIPYLVKSIQEQQVQIQELSAEITILKNK